MVLIRCLDSQVDVSFIDRKVSSCSTLGLFPAQCSAETAELRGHPMKPWRGGTLEDTRAATAHVPLALLLDDRRWERIVKFAGLLCCPASQLALFSSLPENWAFLGVSFRIVWNKDTEEKLECQSPASGSRWRKPLTRTGVPESWSIELEGF